MRTSRITWLAAVFLVFAVNSLCLAETMASPPEWSQSKFDAQLRKSRVQPRWLSDENRFWYLQRNDSNQVEYHLVNALTGKIKSGTNPSQLGLPVAKETLTSSLQLAEESQSRNGGTECSVTFVNRLPKPIEVYWLNTTGKEVKFGSILPQASLVQKTYEGHLWKFVDASGTLVARLSADPFRSRIVIDGASAPVKTPASQADSIPEGTSPDGVWHAKINRQKITLTNSKTQQTQELTAPGDSQETFQGKIAWSPRSDAFVVSMTAPLTTRKITIGKSLQGDQDDSQLRTISYAKPGDPMPQPVPVLFRQHGGKFEPLVIDQSLFQNQFSESRSHEYIWSKDGREFYFDYNQRGHQCFRVLAVDVSSGAVRSVIEEMSPTFIDYRKKTWKHWLPSTQNVLWLSERSGWCHLWKFDVTGKRPPQQLTSGNWLVRDVLRVDEDAGTVWFTASGVREGENPYHVHLCSVQIDGQGFRQLTDGDGVHEIEFSPNGRYFVDTWSRVDHPPVTELRHNTDGKLICEVVKSDETMLTQFSNVIPERFIAKARDGSTDIYGIIIKPSNFDQTKSYPVVEDLYAGPHSAFCPTKFGSYSRLQALAELGFIVVKADGMGTNFRGKAFHDVCWRNLKDAGFPDRIAWIKSAAKTRPWMDLSRVGVIGGSAGGQNAMRALLDHSDFYHVAVADCGCHDNRVDKLWWNEQWMGWPVDESYARSSNVDDAAKLQGHLLLIVGESDENVDPDSTLQVVEALKKAGKPYEFAPIKGTGHGAAETESGSRIRKEFLIRHLKPETTPST